MRTEVVIFDLEATCWAYKNSLQTSEIIEIGAYKVDTFGTIIGEFDKLVKPKIQPSLSQYCTNLTGISNAMIAQADSFEDVFTSFKNWCCADNENAALISWGTQDLDLIKSDCNSYDIACDWVKHVDLKARYRDLHDLSKAYSFNKALKRESIEFEGRQHSALDDSFNLTKLYIKRMGDWRIENTLFNII